MAEFNGNLLVFLFINLWNLKKSDLDITSKACLSTYLNKRSYNLLLRVHYGACLHAWVIPHPIYLSLLKPMEIK